MEDMEWWEEHFGDVYENNMMKCGIEECIKILCVSPPKMLKTNDVGILKATWHNLNKSKNKHTM